MIETLTPASSARNMAPLSERLTLVLISHNRPVFLRRVLQYYRNYPCSIMVLDSSVESDVDIEVDFPGIDYQHLPQFSYSGLQDKLTYGVERVTTPYMVFAAVDDFLLHGALTESVEFLEENPDYGFCHGYTMMYLARASEVKYYRRDKKVIEDYSSERAEDRILSAMKAFIPPFYAVTRTALLRTWYGLLPPGTSFEWQEIGHAYYLLASAKGRILPMAYSLREANYQQSEHNTDILTVVHYDDPKSTAEREGFAEFLASLPTGVASDDKEQARQFALKSFAALNECLRAGHSLTVELIFESASATPHNPPQRRFGPKQYVELPFYNQPFFDQLTDIEFLIHAMPAGRLQLQELEGVWTRQADLMRYHNNDTTESIVDRLWLALDLNMFNRQVVKRLSHNLEELGDHDVAAQLVDWSERLDALSTAGNHRIFDSMLSGRLLKWLEARSPDAGEVTSIFRHLEANEGGPKFGVLLLDLDNDVGKLQATLDSLLEGHCKAFKVVVFTIGEPQVATTAQNTLHFVRVTPGNYVDKLNQITRQLSCDWFLLAQAGDEFTASGLLRASLELMSAPECRAVATDEIQRQSNGALVDVFRPGFNLDLLQSVPSLMARHWLIRRDVLLEAGGYQADFSKALEFDLLLRIIEQGGLSGLAHLDEPLVIAHATELEENAHERLALMRHLGHRGYKAQITSALPGTYQIDYRHTERPLVSIIVNSEDNLPLLQRCLDNVLLRTRYTRYEVLIADNCSQSAAVASWLDAQAQQGGKVRVLRREQRLSASALYNAAAEQAQGAYLVLLAADGEVINPNWIESLLNQAQRPEVGIVGPKLIDRDGKASQAGLIIGMNGGVASAFIGEPKEAAGYLNRLVVEQNYSAVSAACLMIRKELFDALGGLDEVVFADAFSDVDLCLKAGQAGFLTVWTPQVQVVHPGALPESPDALAALRDKWGQAFQQDQAYNQNLALTGKGFTLGDVSSVNWMQLLA